MLLACYASFPLHQNALGTDSTILAPLWVDMIAIKKDHMSISRDEGYKSSKKEEGKGCSDSQEGGTAVFKIPHSYQSHNFFH